MTSHSEPKGAPILQVLIVAYGREGIDSVASLAHPEVEGVEYLVSWQTADCLELTVAAPEEIQAAIPAALREREDFRIFPSTAILCSTEPPRRWQYAATTMSPISLKIFTI